MKLIFIINELGWGVTLTNGTIEAYEYEYYVARPFEFLTELNF